MPELFFPSKVLHETASDWAALLSRSNLLIDNEGNHKLVDFGLARSFSNEHNANLTNRVITLWYSFDRHALELLEKMLTFDSAQK
ncbi:Cyclin-dependent kinase C-1 [Spatholobus suberectus]|nr:Cyclin-dependent kinase C-1 [Spatholobus suberectus]